MQPFLVQPIQPAEPATESPVVGTPVVGTPMGATPMGATIEPPPLAAVAPRAAQKACLSCGDVSAAEDFCPTCSDRSRQSMLSPWDDLGEVD